MEGPSTSGEPKDLIGVTARKKFLALLFPSPSLVTPLVCRRDLSKGIISNFLQKFNFSIPIPFTGQVRISWHHPAKERHPSLGQRSQWQVGTVAHNWEPQPAHVPQCFITSVQPQPGDLIQIQRVFINASEIKEDLFLT